MRGLSPWSALLLLCLVGLPGRATATYSPPLTRVRIDQDQLTHTPSVLLASERHAESLLDVNLFGVGGQYVGQLEWKSGFGLQLGAALGGASFSGQLRGATLDASGFFAGGQARAYYMLYSGGGGERPHALTAFVNLRALYYRGSAGGPNPIDLESFALSGGLGLMGELAVLPWVSICPYAWLTPGFSSSLDYGLGRDRFSVKSGVGLRSPFLFGVDVWIYPFGGASESHLSLSAIAALFDTSGLGSRVISGAIGYTF